MRIIITLDGSKFPKKRISVCQYPKKEGYSTILHEFAHCWLRHKSSPSLSESEIIHQEKDASGLAEEWFREYNLSLKTNGQPTIWEQVREKDEHQNWPISNSDSLISRADSPDW